jgi:Tol biopolymer transport system component
VHGTAFKKFRYGLLIVGVGSLGGPSVARPSPSVVLPPTPIVFASDRAKTLDIYVIAATGGAARRVIASPAADVTPGWSPDRKQIVFGSNRDGRWHIWRAGADGSKPRRLTATTKGADTNPVWSPDGKSIAFASSRTSNWEIYVMSASGARQRNITRDPGADDLDPAWSPDSKTIVFERITQRSSDLYAAKPAKPGVHALLRTPFSAADPAWSPDGKQIAFDRVVKRNQDIWVMNANGSGLRRLTQNPSEDSEPSWSPDGSQIVFTSFRDGDYELYVTDRFGNKQRDLTTSHGATDFEPAWSAKPGATVAVRGPAAETRAEGFTCSTPQSVTAATSTTLRHVWGYDSLPDTLCGSPGREWLSSRGYPDTLWGDIARDYYEGGCGNDTMYARDGYIDTLYGGSAAAGDCGTGEGARVDKDAYGHAVDILHGIENPNL